MFFQWSKDNRVISDTRVEITSVDKRNSKLTIEKVSSSDSGNYTCNVRNDFGQDSFTVTLIVKGMIR